MADLIDTIQHPGFVSDDPGGTVLGAVRADLTLAELVRFDPVEGDTIFRAFGAGGGIRFQDSEGNPIAGNAHSHELAELLDVTITAPAAGEFLRWSGTEWVNAAIAWGDVEGPPETATRWPTFTEVTGKPDTATRWPAVAEVTGLLSGGLIDTALLPALAISETFTAASQAAMLALTAQKGDVAVRTDVNRSFILAGSNPTVLADWKELLSPTDAVLSVNGQVGAVSLTLAQLSGVTIATPAAGQVLQHDGSGWVNSAITFAEVTGSLTLAQISATGTRDATTYLRGDGTWATVPAGGSSSMADGSAGAPGWPFGADLDTGLFRPSADVMAMATGGVERIRLSAAGLTISQGILNGPLTIASGGYFIGSATYGLRINDATNSRNNFITYESGDVFVYRAMLLGGGGFSPAATASLELGATDRGLLMNRLTTTQRDAITSPPNGLVIYNTTANAFQGRAGGAWVNL